MSFSNSTSAGVFRSGVDSVEVGLNPSKPTRTHFELTSTHQEPTSDSPGNVGVATQTRQTHQNRHFFIWLPSVPGSTTDFADCLTQSPFFNKSINELSSDEKKQFYGYRFAVRNLYTEDDDQVRDMFRRLNKYLTPLNAQELRHATFAGPFVRMVEKLSDNEYWAENKIVSAASIRRMGDVQFVSELVIGTLHGPQGGGAAVIDEYYRIFEDYDDEFPDQRKAQKAFDQTLALIQEILPDIKETRWGNKTDFYTFFVALAQLTRSHSVVLSKRATVRKALDKLEKEVEVRLSDESAHVSSEAVDYVRAVEKGANDKPRRAARHTVITSILESALGGKSTK